MADFLQSWNKTFEHEGGYQANVNDDGNYFLGMLIGTKYGITPQTYYNTFKVIPTVELMKNLTKQKASEVAKKIFDSYGLYKIPKQFVADNCFDILFNHSYTTASNLIQKSCLQVNPNSLPKYGNDKKYGTETLNAIIDICNKGKATEFNKFLVENRIKFFENRVQNEPSQLVFIAGWLRRAGSYLVAEFKAKSKQILLLFGIGALAYYLTKK